MMKEPMGQMLKTAVVVLALAVNVWAVEAELRFADILTDNMVLQRGTPITCWGTAPAGSDVELLLTQSRDEAVAFAGEAAFARPEKKPARESHPVIGKVRLAYSEDSPADFKPVRVRVRADKAGRWEATLGEHAASFVPTYLAARAGDERIALQNLLIGEVWIASGQSNMEWAWTRDKMWENQGLVFNGLRYAKVRGASALPRDSFVGNATVGKGAAFEPWLVCEDGNVNAVATIPYLFGQYLHRRLKVPVGIINTAQGGSFGHEWCSREMLERMHSPTVDALLSKFEANQKGEVEVKWRGAPTELYNARLYPIRKLTVAGVIYMQGENDSLCGTLPQYVKTFPGVIHSYRTAFGRPDLPFGIITLQGYGGYQEAREIHLQTHKKTPHTGYIVAHDIGGNIHPTWKRPLAERAVYWALRDVYKVLRGARQLRIRDVVFENVQASITFEEAELKDCQWANAKPARPRTNDQQPYAGFEIAGSDRAWYRGRITLGRTPEAGLTVSHPFVPEPVALRYAWCGFPTGNLGAWEDPVPPFRSDDWPIVGKDSISEHVDGQLGEKERQYLEGHARRNRALEDGLRLAVADSYENLTKRYAHPKGMLQETLKNIDALIEVFDATKAQKLAPELRQQALHKIPVRYWRRDRYTPSRRAKWGWLIERVLRLEELPDEMAKAVNSQGLQPKLEALRQALAELEAEVVELPDPPAMDFDTMLDKVLEVMDAEKARLTAEGVDMEKQKGELSKNPF